MNNHPWLVLYTRPRHEKKAASQLQAAVYEVYCPTVKTVRQWSDRKKKVQIPLFASFFFIRIEERSRQEVFRYPGLVRYLFWNGKPAMVRDEEILAIRAFINDFQDEAEIKVENLPAPGERVQINSGVLAGQTGEVVRVKSNNQVVVRVESLGLQLVAEMHGTQVSGVRESR